MIGGYVYIFKRKRSDRRARITFQAQYKIGISDNVDRRFRKVNRAVPGGVKKIDQFWFLDPRSVEKFLHKLYRSSRRNLRRSRPGAGHTEWFDLHIFEYWSLRLILLCLWGVKFAAAFCILFLIAYLGTGLHLPA